MSERAKLQRRAFVGLAGLLPLGLAGGAGGCAPVAPAAPHRTADAGVEVPAAISQPTTLETVDIAETIPTGLGVQARHPSIADTWIRLINGARERLDIAQFYLSNQPTDKSGSRLEPVIQAVEAAAARGVRVRLLADAVFAKTYPATLERLRPQVALRLFDGSQHMGGILHAKYLLADAQKLFLGSANFDWRSLEHIHELGVVVDSTRLGGQLQQLFDADWRLSESDADMPARPPVNATPAAARLPEGVPAQLLASPRDWLPPEIPWDLPTLVAAIDGATAQVRLQLLSLQARYRDGRPFEVLHAALARAGRRGVDVQVLLSHWEQRAEHIVSIKALARQPGVTVRLCTVPPASTGFIPFARVIHAKYLVIDRRLSWIGTSNGGGDYFHSSRNVGLILRSGVLAAALGRIFDGWYSSEYTAVLDPERTYAEPHIG